MTNEPGSDVVTIFDYHEGFYVNSLRTTGVLEILFLTSPEDFCFRFSGVENIEELQSQYRNAVNAMELVISIARLGYGREDKFQSKALCSPSRT